MDQQSDFPAAAVFAADELVELRLVGALHLLDVPLDLAADAGVLGEVPGQGHRRQRAARVDEIGDGGAPGADAGVEVLDRARPPWLAPASWAGPGTSGAPTRE